MTEIDIASDQGQLLLKKQMMRLVYRYKSLDLHNMPRKQRVALRAWYQERMDYLRALEITPRHDLFDAPKPWRTLYNQYE